MWPGFGAASNPRPLAVRVAHREHHAGHALFSRPCGRCNEIFEYCGSCQPGRLYCGAECSEDAREESVRVAHAKFNDRTSPEGLEVHRLEEKERRDRKAKARDGPVGDQRLPEETGELTVPALVTPYVATEVRDARLEPAVTLLPAVVVEAAPAEREPVEWILVAWPEVLATARRRLGTEASCPFCGRRGRIVRVVTLHEWQRWIRRGLEPPT